MAIRNRIFSQCSNVTNTVVLQYNDIFFVPGTIAFYDNQCWTDTLVNSSLTPLADVTFNNYPTCQDCNETNLQGVEIQSYDTSDLAIITVPIPQTPNIGDVILYDGGCWEVISLTDANLNIVDELNNYGTLAVCVACASLCKISATEASGSIKKNGTTGSFAVLIFLNT